MKKKGESISAKTLPLYCESLFYYERRTTNDVYIGNTAMGSKRPIRTQTMTTTDTLDIESTVEQCIRIAQTGADYVRITAQGIREAEALKLIRAKLCANGYDIPLIADIHFNPAAAETAACNVEKVRINPGNFVDKRADFIKIEFTDKEYQQELTRLHDKFIRLLNICKENNTALRIGANHGSLSDRIMSRYGNTPAGMVESAMEFLRICKKEKFDNVVVSMKSSNTRVMVQAYRLVVSQMKTEGMAYPLHLGVTEAGNGEDGRIKSAVGIGTLFADGLGDTIRVSLTEEPENEIPVARALVEYFRDRKKHSDVPVADVSFYHPYDYVKRASKAVKNMGGNHAPVVMADLSFLSSIYEKDIENLGFTLTENGWRGNDSTPDYIYMGSGFYDFITDGLQFFDDENNDFIFCNISYLTVQFIQWLKQNPHVILILETNSANGVAEQRSFFLKLAENNVGNPVIIRRKYNEDELTELQLKAACDLGALLIDGFGDGIMLSNSVTINKVPNTEQAIVATAFGILQASRVRFSKTEFIACPGCGRTLFDLCETLAKVRSATSHLKGLKIGIMGCIVNGPGEMADADYGYVGAGPGRISLYKGQTPVKKNIPQENAIEEMIALIKEYGDWHEREINKKLGKGTPDFLI
ncbi:MAG: (E)-4-hydroxy-3-methylbut-2-enyl-diphosphate synthase [Prevotellaceae bacterium]|jgi:(E)-4-hydroxy-3-methylbut-2-enyl-diphosphate synthase|nr:(E)-4-hydroxy-3-methylbut-2-enyl-diphosphate synthase [Prevotellaceae bacterium]